MTALCHCLTLSIDMAEFPKLPGLPGLFLQLTGLLTESAISSIRNFSYEFMNWMGEQAENISDYPVVRNTELARQLRRTSDALKEAGSVSFESIYGSIHRAAESLSDTLLSLKIIDNTTFQNLSVNIAQSSILGDSFLNLKDPFEVQTSFRGQGIDLTTSQVATWVKESAPAKRRNGVMICIPGLYQDESLWQSGKPQPISELLRQRGYLPIFLRLHPGSRVTHLGKQVSELLQSLSSELPDTRINILTFGQGGLILRSALIANQKINGSVKDRLSKVILVSSPDGGYFIEKTGLLFGFGMGEAPERAIKFMSFASNVHSPAFRDMAVGIIREEDESKSGPILPLGRQHYFGELENVDAYQIYSLISDSNHIWSNWLGDGLIEESSLTLLTDTVFQAIRNPTKPDLSSQNIDKSDFNQEHANKDRTNEKSIQMNRVHCIMKTSHFQILESEAFQKTLFDILEQ